MWTTTTNSAGTLAKQLVQGSDLAFRPNVSTTPDIAVDPATTYQTITTGFGGGMPDSAAYLINGSPEEDQIMDVLYSAAGAHFDFTRLPMGASDLSLTNYTYDDMPAGQTDPTLAHFSVAHDAAYIIPVLQKSLAIDPSIKIDAAPWSAPAWMKQGDTYLGDCSGTLNYLNPQYYSTYAEYFAKFVQAYENQYHIPIYIVTMQNEPENCSPGYATMNFDATGPNPNEATFAGYLRSALDNAGERNVQILGYDHNWYGSHGDPTTYPQRLLAANSADVNAIGYHCYNTPNGVSDPYDVQTTLHDQYPNVAIYFTECAGGAWATDQAGNLDWETLNNIIGPVNNWAQGSAYETVALDPHSGPNVATPQGGCGDCRGMITVDNTSGTFTLNEEFLVWAQVAKFVQQGAVVVSSSDLESDGLPSVAFRNPDGSIVLEVLNSNSYSQTFGVTWQGQGFNYTLPANSVATFVWDPQGPAPRIPTMAPLGAYCGAPVTGQALNRSNWVVSTNTDASGSDAAANAIDGDMSTRFSSDEPQADGEYWQADLGTPQTFDELQMQVPNSPGDFAKSYDVEVSDNGTDWYTVASCEGTGDPETVSFPPVTAQYMRVVDTMLYDGLATTTGNWWSIDELNLYESER